ncbi:MAG TPA: hypothetical protein VM580_23100 [Labilithrix sp.]|jgi:hypothetical protein|nr:hypothetical protein [Labilithrix sp.]
MNTVLSQTTQKSLTEDTKTFKRLQLNHKKNLEQDHTKLLDAAALAFRYEDCKDVYWNPEPFSLLWGTPIWDGATASQRVLLNQLYWVAYYSQIISAEIATIFFNQTAGASLYGIEDFRLVCDTLDTESSQERAHINAFKKVSEDVEAAVFGERVFSYAMRGPYAETMIHSDTDRFRRAWKGIQLRGYSVLSSSNAFVGCQYFTVRGVRTLNGKLVQHQLSQYYMKAKDKESMPIPSKISYYHFMDESFHFNSSMLISKDVINTLPAPTALESVIANAALRGCQKDHANFSTAINGIFWYDPSLFGVVEKVLRSKAFGLGAADAKELIRRSFCEENDGMHASQATHRTACESYKTYLKELSYVWKENKEMAIMAKASVSRHLAANRRAFEAFARA